MWSYMITRLHQEIYGSASHEVPYEPHVIDTVTGATHQQIQVLQQVPGQQQNAARLADQLAATTKNKLVTPQQIHLIHDSAVDLLLQQV